MTIGRFGVVVHENLQPNSFFSHKLHYINENMPFSLESAINVKKIAVGRSVFSFSLLSCIIFNRLKDWRSPEVIFFQTMVYSKRNEKLQIICERRKTVEKIPIALTHSEIIDE